VIYLCDTKRHLICEPYSVENLHKMAKELSIKPCWFHRGDLPHYDIPKRRMIDVMARCKLITTQEIVNIIGRSGNGRCPLVGKMRPAVNNQPTAI